MSIPLSCPFCGQKAVDSYNGEYRYVRCTGCKAKGPCVNVLDGRSNDNRDYVKWARELWNKRNAADTPETV